jgi:hypothetical protein
MVVKFKTGVSLDMSRVVSYMASNVFEIPIALGPSNMLGGT